jgi:hypothetical protein
MAKKTSLLDKMHEAKEKEIALSARVYSETKRKYPARKYPTEWQKSNSETEIRFVVGDLDYYVSSAGEFYAAALLAFVAGTLINAVGWGYFVIQLLGSGLIAAAIWLFVLGLQHRKSPHLCSWCSNQMRKIIKETKTERLGHNEQIYTRVATSHFSFWCSNCGAEQELPYL